MNNGFVMQRRAEFMDTDMAGIVHFTAYFRYMETAEHELFRTLGLAAATQDGERRLGWPRVSCGFDFKEALRFQELFEVHLGVTNVGQRSITYTAEIIRDRHSLAQGYSTCVCCEIGPDHAMRAIDIPSDITEKLEPYLITERNGTDEDQR